MVLCALALLSVAVSACADGADECSYLGLYKVSFWPHSHLFFSVSAHIFFSTSAASQSLSHKLQRCSPLDLDPLFCNTAVTYSPQNLWPQTQTFFIPTYSFLPWSHLKQCHYLDVRIMTKQTKQICFPPQRGATNRTYCFCKCGFSCRCPLAINQESAAPGEPEDE